MKLRLRHKFTGLAVVSALLPVLGLLLLFGVQEGRVSSLVFAQFELQNHANLKLAVRELKDVLQTADSLLQGEVNLDLNVAQHFFDEAGAVTLGPETVAWNAVNQDTRQTEALMLPQMKLGGQWLGQNSNLDVPTPIVDEVTQLVGGTCTIFQRINDAGDMLRVATNVAVSGERAIGTFIPATSRVVQTVLAGNTYQGPAFVVNAWYLSAYQPIQDAQGRIVGMLYVGSPVAAELTRRLIGQQDFQGRDFAWISQGKNERGLPPFVLYGESQSSLPAALTAVQDVQGQPVFEPLVREAIAHPGEVLVRQVSWHDAQDPDDPVYYSKSVAFIYYPPWDWVIGIVAYDINFLPVRTAVAQVFDEVRLRAAAAALVFLIAVGFLATYLGRKLAAPITFLTNVARHVADGDIAKAARLIGAARTGRVCTEAVRATDESGQLYQAIAEMIDNLQGLLGRVHSSSDRLRTSAATLTGAARDQESLVQDFGASTNQIAAAVREISATAQELAKTMSSVSDLAAQTAAAANAGRAQLEAVTSTGAELTRATAGVSKRLTAIADKARNINSVVTAITKVADQTNLLSLNAAIEAEKAGDYGLGFAVVAREIRRLADQTAEATLDIEQMVREMQSAVSAGVMEMDKFSETVRTGSERSLEVTGHLGNIIQQVEDLTPRLAAVKEGMAAQSQGAQQISEAVAALNQGAQRTDEALDGLKSATRTLDGAVAGLQEGVTRFRLADDGAEPPAGPGPEGPPPPPAPKPPARKPGTPAPFPRGLPGTSLPFRPRPRA